MALCFIQATEVEWVNTCSVSTSLLTPPPATSPNLMYLAPTFPLFFCFSVLGARAKNLKKICNLFSLVVSSRYERCRNTRSIGRANDTFRPQRQTGLRGFFRRQNARFPAEKSFAFQGPQAAKPGQQHGATIHKEPRAIQLKKLLGRGRCLDEMLRADQGVN